MTTYADKYSIPPDAYAMMRQKGLSAKECDFCHSVLLAVKNIRDTAYCINCEGKASHLKRYSNPNYNPTEAEKARILQKLKRAGN